MFDSFSAQLALQPRISGDLEAAACGLLWRKCVYTIPFGSDSVLAGACKCFHAFSQNTAEQVAGLLNSFDPGRAGSADRVAKLAGQKSLQYVALDTQEPKPRLRNLLS